jgi:hypothetical protein
VREAVTADRELAAGHAVVGVDRVAVVALLEALVDVAVSARRDVAIGGALTGLGVLRAQVTLLAGVDDAVATVGAARVAVAVAAAGLGRVAVAVTVTKRRRREGREAVRASDWGPRLRDTRDSGATWGRARAGSRAKSILEALPTQRRQRICDDHAQPRTPLDGIGTCRRISDILSDPLRGGERATHARDCRTDTFKYDHGRLMGVES